MTPAAGAVPATAPRRRQPDRRLRLVYVLLVLLAGSLGLAAWLAARAGPRPLAFIGAPLHSVLVADYSADPLGTRAAVVEVGIIQDVIAAQTTGTPPPDRLATVIVALATPVPSVTLLPGTRAPATQRPTATTTPSATAPHTATQTASPTPTSAPPTALPTLTATGQPSRLPPRTATPTASVTRPPLTATATTGLPTDPPPPPTDTAPPPTQVPPTATPLPPTHTPEPPPPTATDPYPAPPTNPPPTRPPPYP
jgi:hypothetical protein